MKPRKPTFDWMTFAIALAIISVVVLRMAYKHYSGEENDRPRTEVIHDHFFVELKDSDVNVDSRIPYLHKQSLLAHKAPLGPLRKTTRIKWQAACLMALAKTYNWLRSSNHVLDKAK